MLSAYDGTNSGLGWFCVVYDLRSQSGAPTALEGCELNLHGGAPIFLPENGCNPVTSSVGPATQTSTEALTNGT